MIAIVVACDKNGVIGSNGTIPWHIPEDLKLFKKITTDSIVIMGRKTWESIPEKFRPLSGRINIVVSTSMHTHDDCTICKSLEEAIGFSKYLNSFQKMNVFIIGGESIYKEALKKHYPSRLYISHINKEYQGDTYFKFNKNEWETIEKTKYTDFTAVTYQRKKL